MKACAEYIKGDVCDLGCNHGACTFLMMDFNDVKSIHGVDINLKALELAYDTASKITTNIKFNFYRANLMEMPIEDEKFDFVMSFHTLEHIFPNDVHKVVSEIHRIMKPNAHVLISIPYDHAYPDAHHVAFYKEDTLKDLFESHGFETKECFKDDRFYQKDLLTAIFTKPAGVHKED